MFRNSRILKIAVAYLLMTFLCLMSAISSSLAELDENEVKLAFIYNFAKFVDWPYQAPQDAGIPLTFCVLGDDQFGNKTNSIENKSVGEKRIQVRRIRNVEEARGCQMLFISSSEKNAMERDLRALQGSSILTISDVPGFIKMGGMIGFIELDNKIRFEINVGSARLAKLEISSKLLKLAETVKDGQ